MFPFRQFPSSTPALIPNRPAMNYELYPWLQHDFASTEAQRALEEARSRYIETGAVTFPNFITQEALQEAVREARSKEDEAFTTDDVHTAYLKSRNLNLDENSVYNYEMRTKVASTAYDELSTNSALKKLYQHPKLLQLVSFIVNKKPLFLSDDPLGCCSINVFRPSYHHSFHFDESEFSTTLMLQESEVPGTGLFQYTDPLRQSSDDLALDSVARTIQAYADIGSEHSFAEISTRNEEIPQYNSTAPSLHTLDFTPGTLLIFSGSRSLHRVTKVEGSQSRLVAVLTFATRPGFRNSAKVQKLFWGRSSSEE